MNNQRRNDSLISKDSGELFLSDKKESQQQANNKLINRNRRMKLQSLKNAGI
jgi:hypothetical protein